MIVLPALAGFTLLLQQILEGAALGALFGALFGGAIGGGGEALAGVQEHGEVNRQVIENMAEGTVDGAIDGAVGGAVTGGLFGIAGAAFHPVLAVIDDFFRSIFGWLDDAARGVARAADDVLTGIKNTAKSVVNGIRGQFNRWRNGWNAQNFKAMKDAPTGTRYVYVMEDSANGVHKIGMTTKAPPKRLEKVAREAKSKVDYTCIIQTDKNSKLEGNLHSLFSNRRTTHPTIGYDSTEWFALSAAQVAAACSH